MKLAAIALAAAAAALPAAPAVAEPVAAGQYCGMSVHTDGSGTYSGDIESAPVFAAEIDDVTRPVSVTVSCDIQLNGTGSYSDPDAVHATATGTTVTYVPSRDWAAGVVGDHVWLCTTWVVEDADGRTTTYYRDSTTDAMTTDPSVSCYGVL